MHLQREPPLTTAILLAVLATALMHASWNALVQSAGDRLTSLASMQMAAAVLMAPLVFVVPLPGTEVWALLALTLFLHTAYKLFLIRAYAHGGLGHVYPVARGGAPLLVAGASFLLLGETMELTSLAGMLLVVAGILSLTFKRNGSTPDEKRATIYALITAFFIAAYTTVDGIGARTAASPHIFVIWLFVLDGLVFGSVALWRRGFNAGWTDRALVTRAAMGAFLQIGAYWVVLWAMTKAPLGLVSALRETSVVFAALISSAILKERLGPIALLAAAIVAAGVVLIRM